jgi:hypothetical protein
MRTELIPVIPGRPPVLKKDGQWHYISLHDKAYLARLRSFRNLLTQAHPDRPGGSTKAFVNVGRNLKIWKDSERAWYWLLGLMPPDWSGPLTMPPWWTDYKAKYPTGSAVRFAAQRTAREQRFSTRSRRSA